MQLEDKIALVTGAGRGMGRAISLQLAEAGANIAVSDIDASTAEDTAVAVKQLGRESIVLPADMGDLRDIDRMFSQAKDAFGRIVHRLFLQLQKDASWNNFVSPRPINPRCWL